MNGRNIGDLLNAKGVTWGWFQGGFRPTATAGLPTTDSRRPCAARPRRTSPVPRCPTTAPHHEPFQYYASTANPHHLPPSSVGAIGQTDQANHQYDLTDFYAALGHGNLPAVSFLKAPWPRTATPATATRSTSRSSSSTRSTRCRSPGLGQHRGRHRLRRLRRLVRPRHGPGRQRLHRRQRLPAGGRRVRQRHAAGRLRRPLRLRPAAAAAGRLAVRRTNYVDHTLTDQTSILRFVEDNWLGGQRIGDGSFDALAGPLDGMFDWRHPTKQRLLLDPATGAPAPEWSSTADPSPRGGATDTGSRPLTLPAVAASPCLVDDNRSTRRRIIISQPGPSATTTAPGARPGLWCQHSMSSCSPTGPATTPGPRRRADGVLQRFRPATLGVLDHVEGARHCRASHAHGVLHPQLRRPAQSARRRP